MRPEGEIVAEQVRAEDDSAIAAQLVWHCLGWVLGDHDDSPYDWVKDRLFEHQRNLIGPPLKEPGKRSRG